MKNQIISGIKFLGFKIRFYLCIINLCAVFESENSQFGWIWF